MASTPNFNWSTPDNTGLVKNGALDIRTLGNAIDASLVDLKGGTTGQVLTKASGTDMDFSWTAVDPLVILDAKGDLITATAADTPARLAVGTNNQVLTADSSTATGLKWATPATSTPTFVGCALYMDANQTLTNNTVTNLTWGAENFDTDSFHSTVTNTSRITIPSGKDGKYLFAWSVAYFANATGIRETALRKNGTSITYQDFPVSSNGSETNMTATFIANAVATDYFELAGYQNSGGNLDVRSGISRSFFHCTYLGA
jgi:hypothetical protein